MAVTNRLPSEFHPLIQDWFFSRFHKPTDIQRLAWPKIIRGEHVLISAPTGSGKTLTAFLWAVNELIEERWEHGRTRILYVSPLKALNNDIRRTLNQPLSQLRALFKNKEASFPPIRALTRSGDTPQTDRRQMLRQPPEILITTPESLNLLLSSASGRILLNGLKTVILDEIHTVFNSKRGVHLITAVDRLVPLCGEFQRVAISATIRPMEEVAAFIGGFRRDARLPDKYIPRPVSPVQSVEKKRYHLSILSPREEGPISPDRSFWAPLVEESGRIIERNRSTLLFANSRRLTESLTFQINSTSSAPLAYAHHGSLSRELRTEVESKLKKGELRAIIATNSLELGIDIGSLDEVVLFQTPPSLSSATQRVGRAGHRVGEVSRGTFLPTHELDSIQSAVAARALEEGDIEPTSPVLAPLDVLAQILVSMTGMESWDLDELYAFIKTSYPFHELPRRHFELVLDMLSGRYAHHKIRELQPKISVDRLDNTAVARKGALLDIYSSGGTIPDRGYFNLRHEQTGARIGELDEEYVWEAKIGQTMTFGTQHWNIRRITHNDVFVRPSSATAAAAPFWRAEGRNRDTYFSRKIAGFLLEADRRLEDEDFHRELREAYFLEDRAVKKIIRFLRRQKTETKAPLPHLTHILVEHIDSGPGGAPGNQVVFHTFWGGPVNRPWAMALEAGWEERYGERLEIFAGNDAVVLHLPHAVNAEAIFSLVNPANIDVLLRKRLEGSGFFGARFREAAGRALLLTRKINQRMPLWMNRLRSRKLLQAVLNYPDFPLLLETWRTCYQDEFDIDMLRNMLRDFESGELQITECVTSRPSPMAEALSWSQINQYMYAGDEPPTGRVSQLRSDLLREMVFSPELRPAIESKIITEFEAKRQRLSPGYPPSNGRELVDWIKERTLIPQPEWEQLLKAALSEDPSLKEDLESVSDKIGRLKLPGADHSIIVSMEDLRRLLEGFGGEIKAGDLPTAPDLRGELISRPPLQVDFIQAPSPEEIRHAAVKDWIQFYGPLAPGRLGRHFGLPREIDRIVDDLIETGALIRGRLVKGTGEEFICDADNYETLLRMSRRAARPDFKALPLKELPLFLALFNRLISHDKGKEAVFQTLEQMIGYRAPAPFWEMEILPVRVEGYRLADMEAAIKERGIVWTGDGNRRIVFLFESDTELLFGSFGETADRPGVGNDEYRKEFESLFPVPEARFTFDGLASTTGQGHRKLAEYLWTGVWAGRISNDTVITLRRGIHHRFSAPGQKKAGFSSPRPGARGLILARRRDSLYPGSWFLLPSPAGEKDLMEVEEQRKDLVRILLDRYGILFRELLQREPPPFRWGTIFRALRLMEMSGEVLAGYFFQDIPGPQYVSPKALRLLRHGLPGEAVYWMNAADPASVCGIALESLRETYPKRLDGTHLSFRGSAPMLISQRLGRELTIHIPPEDPELACHFAPLSHLLHRDFRPLRRIIVERINGLPAVESPYLGPLKRHFHAVVDISRVSLYKRVM
jgi:ATP-dependent Lhr-like helicase